MLAVLLKDRRWSTRSDGPEMTVESDTQRIALRRAPPRKSKVSSGALLDDPSDWITEDEPAGKYGLAFKAGGGAVGEGAPSVKSRPLRVPPLYPVRLVRLRWESSERLGAR